MEVQATNLSFKGLNVKKLKSLDAVFLPNLKYIEKMTDGVDVFLKSTQKSFPFRKTTLTSDAVEIRVRPQNISWFEKLFGLKNQKAYYPIGNLRPLIDEPKPSFEELLMQVISKVKG